MTAPLKKYIVTRERCPACESARSETLYRASYTESPIRDYLAAFYTTTGKGVEFEYLDGNEYILEACQDCGLIYQKQVLSALLTRKLYEQWLDPRLVEDGERRERKARYFLWCAAETTRIIEYLKKQPSGLKFLDFGMGRGNWCLIARGFGCDVYAMEISHAWLDRADALGVKLQNWEDLAHHKFDFINAEQVFEHLADPLETLGHLRQALSADGIIRIGVPGCRDFKRKLQKPDWFIADGSPGSLNDLAPLHISTALLSSRWFVWAGRLGSSRLRCPAVSSARRFYGQGQGDSATPLRYPVSGHPRSAPTAGAKPVFQVRNPRGAPIARLWRGRCCLASQR